MRVAVLIPCYNEAQTIAKVVGDFRRALPEAIVYVYDNNSTDGTADIAKEAGAIVAREPRQGKGNVVRAMFRKIEADCYLLVDGDDTYPAEDARQLIDSVLHDGADMAIGDRLSSTYHKENKRRFHSRGNKSVRGIVNLLFKAGIKDILTGYRAFSRVFVKTFPVLSKGFEIEPEMTTHALDKQLTITQIPVRYRDRPAGSQSKLRTVRDGFRVISTIFALFKDYRPLAFFGLFSLLFFGGSVGLFIPVFIDYLETGLVPRMPTLVVSGIMVLASLLSLSCGLILDTLLKQHRQMFELEIVRYYAHEDRK